VGPRLQQPHIAVTTGIMALFIPPGWKNVVYTTMGGFLGGYVMCNIATLDFLVLNFQHECAVSPNEDAMDNDL